MSDDFVSAELVDPRRPTRNIVARILFGALWFLPFWIMSNMFVGAVVGGIAGAATKSAQEGAQAGQRAAEQFFQHYGTSLLVGQFVAFGIIWLSQILPGTGKYKKG